MELFIIYLIASIITLVILYFVIKAAVRNGINESKLIKKDDYNATPDANGYVPVRK